MEKLGSSLITELCRLFAGVDVYGTEYAFGGAHCGEWEAAS